MINKKSDVNKSSVSEHNKKTCHPNGQQVFGTAEGTPPLARMPSLRRSCCGLRGADMPPACPFFAAHPLRVRIPAKQKRRPPFGDLRFWYG